MNRNKLVPELRFEGFADKWKFERLNDTQTCFTDGNYGESYPSNQDFTNSSDGIPFLKGGNLSNGQLNLIGADYITKKKHHELNSGHLCVDDIVIAVRGSLGALGYVTAKESDWNINSQLAIIRTVKNELFGGFLIQNLLSNRGQAELLSKSTGSALKQLSLGQLRQLKIPITNLKEQKKIADYFQNLDTLINQHQRKHEQLTHVKQSMLEKMFPKEGADVPEVRFEGFDDKWKIEPFSNRFDYSVSSNTLSREKLNYETGAIKNIHYGDVLIKFDSYVNISNEDIPFITDSQGKDLRSQYLKTGDMVFADAAEDSTVGKATQIINPLKLPVVAGLHTIVARPKFDFGDFFLAYYLNSNSFHNQLIPLMQGTKVLSISRRNLSNTLLKYSASISEQTQIGEFFKNLDTLINQHQSALEKLKNLKHALLDKMFV